ncbi:MAG TPA: DUF1501 domain-containing protein [Bryobacteraceae bacterium]|nr:DUF1501 domain-containing protein [Bryobacteraceae bacterium]
MEGQTKFDRFVSRYPHPHQPFFHRPHWTRRRFFQILGSGVTASFLAERYARAADVSTSASVTTQNTAKNTIFILLAGAPSHIDTFDFKLVSGVTPDSFAPASISGVTWPSGLLPKMADQLKNIAIVRSMRAWALVHSLAQTWTQIGRNPAAALGNIAPNIGSVVAIEKDPLRLPSQVFPTFLALNSASAAGSGYLPARYAPFKVIPSAKGILNTTNPDGPGVVDTRWSLLHQLDDPLRVNSPLGKSMEDYDNFYQAAKGLMYNPVVNQAFQFSSTDSERYGNTAFGNACLVAKQVLQADQGTRFIQITQGGWDMHSNIYDARQLPAYGKLLDDGLAALLGDLQATGLFTNTLLVMAGEFGRTVGPLSGAQGRDHYPQQFVMFAGAGVTGGKVIGVTNAAGDDVTDFGWSRNRYVKPEDVEATIYSAMGIDWTTVRHDDPFGRGFEYVPFSEQDLYGPVNELWTT